MAEYRTLKMDFWTDPFVEELQASTKLLYLYLISSPHTNNLGVLEITKRRIAYETGLDPQDVENGLAQLETADKVFSDGNLIWLCNFVKNQTTTSPKLIESLKKLIHSIPLKLARRIWERYPNLFDGDPSVPKCTDTVSIPYQECTDTVSIPSGEVEVELGSGSGKELKTNTLVAARSGDGSDLEVKTPKPPGLRVPYSKVVELWNTIMGPRGKPRITELSDSRKRSVRALWRDRPTADFREIETWERFFIHCTKSEILMEAGWFVFDWILKPGNFLKVLESNYHNAPGGRRTTWVSR